MSEGSDKEYKPMVQQLKARTAKKRRRLVRSTRSTATYEEKIDITDSETDLGEDSSEGAVIREVESSRVPDYLSARRSESVSVVGARSSPCWSPGMVQIKTESLL